MSCAFFTRTAHYNGFLAVFYRRSTKRIDKLC
nr:MAG TPA: hypothetical protein [Caudoviricetes sp.]